MALPARLPSNGSAFMGRRSGGRSRWSAWPACWWACHPLSARAGEGIRRPTDSTPEGRRRRPSSPASCWPPWPPWLSVRYSGPKRPSSPSAEDWPPWSYARQAGRSAADDHGGRPRRAVLPRSAPSLALRSPGAFLLMEASGFGRPLLGLVLVPGLLAAGIGTLDLRGVRLLDRARDLLSGSSQPPHFRPARWGRAGLGDRHRAGGRPRSGGASAGWVCTSGLMWNAGLAAHAGRSGWPSAVWP